MNKKKIKIIIFCEYSKNIGLGHYIRSLRLFFFLKKKFFVKIYLNKNKKFINSIFLKNNNKTIYIFDFKNYKKYNFLNNSNSLKIFFDNNKKQSAKNININPLLPSKNFYSGAKWFIYPENFFRKKIFIKRRSLKKNLLICQGGTDANKNILKLVKIVKNKIKKKNFKLNILVPNNYKLDKKLKDKYSVNVYSNIKNMRNFLNKFDHIITSCGCLSYEINFFGISCTYVTSEKKEIKLGKYLKNKGFGNIFKVTEGKKIINDIYQNMFLKKNKNKLKEKKKYFQHNGLKNISRLIETKIKKNEI